MAVQSNASYALINLSCDEGKNLIGEAGGCEAIVATLKAFPDDQQVQETGCWAINNLVNTSDDNRRKVSDAGGCQVIMAALGRFLDNKVIQEYGWSAVGHLAERSESKMVIAEAGGCEAVVASMKALPGNVRVQLAAISVGSSLMKGSGVNKAKLNAAGALGAITEAMRSFPDSESLQKKGEEAIQLLRT